LKARYDANVIAVSELRRVARDRLDDAAVLLGSARYDGAAYLVGYAVEIALKGRISKSLKWLDFPETTKEFEGYSTFRTHKLPILLRLSGREEVIKTKYFAEWSAVSAWDPETRYRPSGSVGQRDAELMIASARVLMKAL